jgi:hypothetical protein
MKKKLFLVLLLVCLIALVGCGGSQVYVIKVTGNTGTEFSGSFGAVTKGGETASRTVAAATVPAEYKVTAPRGSVIFCSFQKTGEFGTMNVQIVNSKGEVVTQNGTTAPHGSVTLTTQ